MCGDSRTRCQHTVTYDDVLFDLPVLVKPLRLSGDMCFGMGPSTQHEQTVENSASPVSQMMCDQIVCVRGVVFVWGEGGGSWEVC